jgi:copper chaperone CopZ
MSCGHCEARVKKALLALDGVKAAEASAAKGEVRISYDESKVTRDMIAGAIDDAGYDLVD